MLDRHPPLLSISSVLPGGRFVAALRRALLASFALLLASCLFDADRGRSAFIPDGYLALQLQLQQPGSMLLKASSADTTFSLDSLKILLTSNATPPDTQRYSYPVTGRADTGYISVPIKLYTLAPLRTWKARFLTLDTVLGSSPHTDTVNLDSVSFSIVAADTAKITRTVAARYAILRVRIKSSAPDSLPASLKYLRIRVGGVTRDSLALTSSRLNGTHFPSLTTGWTVGDSGYVFKSTDGGSTWAQQVSGTTQRLNSVWFADTSTGWASGDAGTLLKTTNSGNTWSALVSGTTQNLKKVTFVDALKGYVTGDNGALLKTTDGGATWRQLTSWTTVVSGVTQNLKDLFFSSASTGWAVGEAGTIRRTTTGGASWTAQVSGVSTTLNAVAYTSPQGIAVGDQGVVLNTTDLGVTWVPQNSGLTFDLRDVYMRNNLAAFIVGKSEAALSGNGTTWGWRGYWQPQTSGTTSAIRDMLYAGRDSVLAVGDAGTVRYTTNGGTAWNTGTTLGTNKLNAATAAFGTKKLYLVGDNGVIYNNNLAFPGTFTSRTSPVTRNLNGISMPAASGTKTGYIVGDSETVLRTTDTVTWNWLESGWNARTSGTTNDLLGFALGTKDTGWAVGTSGKILQTSSRGVTWASTASPFSKSLNAVQVIGGSRGIVVGDSGTTGKSSGLIFGAVISTSSANLKAVSLSTGLGFAVGENEAIVRTLDSGTTWVNMTAGWVPYANAPMPLRAVTSVNGRFVAVGEGGLTTYGNTQNGSPPTFYGWQLFPASGVSKTLNGVGYNSGGGLVYSLAVGDSGKITRSTDNAQSWTAISQTVTSNRLKTVDFGNNGKYALVVGDSETIIRSADTGKTWVNFTRGWYGRSTPTTADLRGMMGTSVAWWAAGTGGALVKTTDRGETWTSVSSGATTDLNAMTNNNGGTGVFVGDGGVIGVTTNSGSLWTATGSGLTTNNLLAVKADGNIYLAAGDSETVLRTTNSGSTWTKPTYGWYGLTSGTSNALNAVAFSGATGVAVGAGPTVLQTTNYGTSWSAISNTATAGLNDVGFATPNLITVGDAGNILSSTNSGGAWTSRTSVSGTTRNLNAVSLFNTTNAWAAGDSSTVRYTTNTGANWLDGSGGWISKTSGTTTLLQSVAFAGRQWAWAVGNAGMIRATTDTGNTWTLQGSGVTSANLNTVVPWTTGATATLVAAGAGGALVRTTNGGSAWGTVTSGTTRNLNAGALTSATAGVLVGDSETVVRTTTSGAAWVGTTGSWTLVNSGSGHLSAITRDKGSATFPGYYYAVGFKSLLLMSTDNGATWDTSNTGIGANYRLRSVYMDHSLQSGSAFAGDSVAVRELAISFTWNASSNTRVIRSMGASTNAVEVGDSGYVSTGTSSVRLGNNGSLAPKLTGQNLNGVSVFSSTRALIVGDSGVILRVTGNFGTTTPTQNRVTGPTTTNLKAVAMTSANVAYAVGDNGTILKCTNANNDNWVALSSPTTANLRAVVFRGNGTADTGYIFGDNGTIFKTLDAGTTWLRQSVSGLTDTITGAVIGTTADTVLFTTTGGRIYRTVNGGGGTIWSGGSTARNYRGVTYSASANKVVAVGTGGAVIQSADSGKTWTARTSGVASALNDVRAGRSSNNMVAVGDSGVIVRSTDAGTTWSTVTLTPPVTANLRRLTGNVSSSSTRFFAVGDNGTILATTDAGITWTRQYGGTANLLGVGLQDTASTTADTALAVGNTGTILRTVNGGWAPGFNTRLRGVSMGSATVGWAVGDAGLIAKNAAAGTNPPRWTTQGAGLTSSNLNGVFAVSATRAYAVGDGGTILRTVDGGTNWTARSSPTSQNLRKVWSRLAAGSMDTLYAVGDNGAIVRSLDSGSTWSLQNSGTSENLKGVFLSATGYGPDTAYAVGTNGTILKTTSGGLRVSGLDSLRSIRALEVTAGLRYFAVGTGGLIARSDNDGTSWRPQVSGISVTLNAVDFKSTVAGWVVGDGGTILKTTDAGVTWTPLTSGTSEDLKWVTYSIGGTADTVYAVGAHGTVLRSVDGTTWSPQQSHRTGTLRAVASLSRDTLIAVGDGGIAVKTNNGGVGIGTSTLPENFTDILGAGVFWLVGTHGTLAVSSDTGLTWQSVASGTTQDLNVISRGSGTSTVYVGGNGGTLLRAPNKTATATWTLLPSIGSLDILGAVQSNTLDTLYVGGTNGTILKVTSAGTSVTSMASRTGSTLRGMTSFLSAPYLAVGDSGAITVLRVNGSTAGGTATLRGVSTVNSTTAWAVGTGGRIVATTNAGASWTAQGVGATAADLNAVRFLNTTNGCAVGSGGTVLKTTDGGANWAGRNAGTTEDFLSLTWKGTTDTGWITGSAGSIYRTTSLCDSLTLQTSGTTQPLYGVFARSSDTGFAVGAGGTLLRTITKGFGIMGRPAKADLKGVVFLTPAKGWTVGSGGLIARTIDSANTWVSQTSGTAGTLYSIVAKDTNTLWAVGAGGVILKTTNTGTLWSAKSSGVTADLYKIRFKANFDTGWATGAGGAVVRTLDGGDTWYPQVSGTTADLYSVAVRSRDTVWAAGAGGVLLKTVKSGANISGRLLPQSLNAVISSTSGLTVVAGDSGIVLRSTDVGLTWSLINSGTTATLNGLAAPAFDSLWAVGNGGVILNSVDSGKTWTSQTSGVTDDLLKVSFKNKKYGYAVGHSGRIVSTTNGGATWVASNGTTVDLAGLAVLGTDSVVAAGDSGTVIRLGSITSANLSGASFRQDTGFVVGTAGTAFRTRNGGDAWTPITGTSADLNAVVLASTGNAVAVGAGGVVATLPTASASTAWTLGTSNATQRLTSVAASAGTYYAVGDSGTIRYATSPAGPYLTPTHNESDSLSGVYCYPGQDTCWLTGSNRIVAKTVDGAGAVWTEKSGGGKLFDRLLTYKYLKPGQNNAVLLQGIDRGTPLRGYETTINITPAAGSDSTVNTGLTKCGYGGSTPACTP